jgi:benzoylformate decarboxylase
MAEMTGAEITGAEMTGAQAMFELLVREGVKYVFGNPGTTELPLMDQFAARDEIEYILALHEDSALGIAAGYAEATGKPAVVNLHTNPGLAHALGNLYNAYRAGTPLIVTAGQQDTRAMIDEPLLWADMIELARQHTKWAWEVRRAEEIPVALARAFKIAQTPPTGPVFISLPVDLMEAKAEMDLPPVVEVGPRIRGDAMKIEQAASILAAARNPAIIAGDRCARSGALSAVAQLAELVAARVHSEPLNSLLCFPTSHPLYAGPLFSNAKQTSGLLAGVDVLLTIGVNNLAPLVYTGTKLIPAGARLLQVDPSAWELGKNFPAEVAIQGDPRASVEELIASLIPKIGPGVEQAARRDKIQAQIREAHARLVESARAVPDSAPLTPGYVALEMRKIAPPETILVDESVTSTAFVRTLFTLDEPGTFYYAKGGSLGIALPAAIGVKLAFPDRPVVCSVGDGTAMYTIQGLWTAARYKLAVVYVVFNNTSYMILKGGLLAAKGAAAQKGYFPGMDITEPEVDFLSLAESMGVPARRASTPAALTDCLSWALAQNGPTLIDVPIVREARSVLR